jgi:hypothetical protein
MPLVGLGTWQMTGARCQAAVRTALQVGYRHIDTATMYRNERNVGRTVRDSGVLRCSRARPAGRGRPGAAHPRRQPPGAGHGLRRPVADPLAAARPGPGLDLEGATAPRRRSYALLSPRAWGAELPVDESGPEWRLTPTGVRSTSTISWLTRPTTAHPHMLGEDGSSPTRLMPAAAHPTAQGARGRRDLPGGRLRLTPTGVGSTKLSPRPSWPGSAHPHSAAALVGLVHDRESSVASCGVTGL